MQWLDNIYFLLFSFEFQRFIVQGYNYKNW